MGRVAKQHCTLPELPPEIYSLCFEKITDLTTISAIMTCNSYFRALGAQFITSIESSEVVPFRFITQLPNLKSIRAIINLTSIKQLLTISAFRRLKRARFQLSYSETLSFDDIIFKFIERYCSGSRNLMKRKFNLKIIMDQNICYDFYILNGAPILKFDGNVDVNQVVSFLAKFRTYSPLWAFDEYWLLLMDEDLDNLNLSTIIKFLQSVPELKRLVMRGELYVYNYYLFSQLIAQISQLAIINPRNLDLNQLPSSDRLTMFRVPVTVDLVPLILQKYPKVECIAIADDHVSPEQLMVVITQYPQLQTIQLVNSDLSPRKDHIFTHSKVKYR